MAFDLSLSPSSRTPAIGLKANLKAGVSSPGTGARRVLLLAIKSSAGTATVDTVLYQNVGGADGVATLLGTGMPGHLWAKCLFTEYGIAAVDVVCMTAGAGVTATKNFTFASTPTVARLVKTKVMGRYFEMTWAASETATDFATRWTAQVNARGTDLACVSTSSGAVSTVNAKAAGTWGNDIIVQIELADGTGGTIDGGQKSTQNLASGTTFADPTNALALVTTREYHFIDVVDGNASVSISGSTSPYYKANTHIQAYNVGASAKLQQQILGYTGTYSAALTAAGYRNEGTAQLQIFQAAQSLPAEIQGAETGARLREIALDPAVNRIGVFGGSSYKSTLYGPLDDVGDKLTDGEIEALLQGGVSPTDWGQDGVPYPVMPITTYYQDALGNADNRILDTSRVDGTYIPARDIRGALAQAFPQKKIIGDLAAGQELPIGCIQIKTIRTFVINRARFWVNVGVWQGEALEEAIANGQFIVMQDLTDPSQVDIVIPEKVLPPLRKISLVVNHVGP